jgi:adenylosuccinate synthase
MDMRALGNTAVVGLQWGDEGKGKIVDLLTEHFDIVVRYAGGANAGHTVWIGDQKFALHLLPSGILRPDALSVIGPGVALDPEILTTEIEGLQARGVQVASNLMISDRAHLVMPHHKKHDRLAEASLGKTRRIGTTAKGIGPCYADRMMRTPAFRVRDLSDEPGFRERLARVVEERNKMFAALYSDDEPLDADAIAEAYLQYGEKLARYVTDTTPVLHEAWAAGKRILFEGAQGALLDINHGTFPYVTSSTCSAGGIAAGTGLPPKVVQSCVGVIKAYTTRVGSGPFPTEQDNAVGDEIRERGHEYGTTTGRPRRCGWFDAVAVRYGIALGGVTQIVVMHLDTLATLQEVRVCTGYRLHGEPLSFFNPDEAVLRDVKPVYETLPGWDAVTKDVSRIEDLPDNAQSYLDRLEALLGVPITLVSVGQARSATLHREAELR